MPFWKCFDCLRFKDEENVTTLDYGNSTLTDVPPDVSQYERTLEQLILSANRISDLPPELFYCLGLRVLKLNDNELESIPNAIGSLRQLQKLDLNRNALSNIPDQIKACKNLTHLDLSLNNLQRLPDAITSLISLQELLLNETYLEFLPANFGRLVKLRILELRSNNLITLPKSMARLVELQRIDIGANEFTELPEVIGQLTQLRELWIDCNRIRRISSNISNLRELVHFEANNNQLTSLPNEIGNWQKLEVLSLSTNDIEEIPFSIGMLKRLTTLKCDSNQLRELPDSICKLDALEELIVSQNFITKLPTTIGLMRNLRFVAADENLLRRVPNEICSCISLSVLSLRGNKIAELPPDIGHLVNMKVINVIDNCIRFLPVSTLNLRHLSALWIGSNQSQPLVPLQYADNESQLTCILLPQSGCLDNGGVPALTSAIANSDHGMYAMANGSPSRRICFADEAGVKATETITTRLMRSPTPYPKELRLMAKYLRNSNQYREHPAPHTNAEMSAPDGDLQIKEARVLSNVQYCDNGNLDQQQQMYLYVQQQAANYMNTNIYGYTQPQPQPLLQQPPLPPQLQQVQYYQNNYADPYNGSIYEQHESIYSHGTQSPQSFHQPDEQLQYVQKARQPPPYHIAKAFTKKSKEDLLYYDTVRHAEQDNNVENNNIDSFASNNVNNNMFLESEMDGEEAEEPRQLTSEQQVQTNGDVDSHSAREVEAPLVEDTSETDGRSVTRCSTSQWVFGLHKNPTVKQVIVKKDPVLGFEVKQKSNENGIFVSITIPNTSASSLLRADDKLLDVDGYDFTDISLDDAHQALLESGPVVTIMLSRK